MAINMKTLKEQFGEICFSKTKAIARDWDQDKMIDDLIEAVKERDKLLLRGIDLIIKMDEEIGNRTTKKEVLDLIRHTMERGQKNSL